MILSYQHDKQSWDERSERMQTKEKAFEPIRTAMKLTGGFTLPSLQRFQVLKQQQFRIGLNEDGLNPLKTAGMEKPLLQEFL